MKIIKDKISRAELLIMAEAIFGDMVKGVVDVEKGILCLDAELHADIEAFLLEQGSKQDNLWGINIYPEIEGDDFLEFDSLINIRPRQNNRSRGVEDIKIQQQIREIVNNKIK
ncbi:MAG: DUF5674 family protein [Bacteroidales bacterium]|jgi:hypothetical protein